MAYLSRAACAAFLAGVGVMATTDAGLAEPSITLASSSSPGFYDYDLETGHGGVAIAPGQTIILSGLSGVTGASVSGDLVTDGFSVFSVTSTKVVFEETGSFAELNGPTIGTLVVDSLAPTGTVDFTINYTLLGVGAPSTSGTVGGPVAAAVPEPATWAMALLGFAGLGFAAHRRAKLKGPVGVSAA